jgi:hypothetical protein
MLVGAAILKTRPHKEAQIEICSFTFWLQNGAHSNDVLQECEDNEDLGMEEMKDQNESRRESSEMRGNSTEWRDWSLQLTDNNELLITGKTNQ